MSQIVEVRRKLGPRLEAGHGTRNGREMPAGTLSSRPPAGPALAGEPRIPEVAPRRRAEAAAELAAGRVEREVVTQLYLAHVLVEDLLDPLILRGPVHELEIDDEPDLFELLLGHDRGLIHELVFSIRYPAYGLAA